MKDIRIKKKYVVLAIITLIVAVGTVSLAYFQGSVINDLINNTKVTTGNVDVKISDASINVSDIKPLYTSNSDYGYEDADFVKKFSIENDAGNLNACVKLYMKINSIDSDLANKYFRYTVVNDETGTTISGSFNGTSSGNDLELGSLYFIESNKSKKYTMYIWIEYDSNVDQMSMLNKTLSGTLYVKATDSKTKDACDERGNFRITYVTYGGSGCSDTNVIKGDSATLCTPTKDNQEFKGWFTDSKYTNEVSSIANINDDIKLYAKWNCPFSGDLVQGAEYVNGDYTYRYKQEGYMPIEGSGTTLAWKDIDTDGWGVQLTDKMSTETPNSNVCTSINGKAVTSARAMYYYSHAKKINLKNFNSYNITMMSEMFAESQFEKLNLSYLDTSNVTDMSRMFTENNSLALDLSSFDTSKVTDISYMFFKTSAKSIDISGFNTSKVTDMHSMFYLSVATDIKGLTDFDTSKVTDMSGMFGSSIIDVIDLSSFTVVSDTDLSYMFSDAKATKGYAKDDETATKFNNSSSKPDTLTFTVK